MALKQTPSQTVGPYFAYGLTSEQYGYPLHQIAGADLTESVAGLEGERIRIAGQVFDANGEPVPDAMIEIWQADAKGRYAHPADERGTNTGFKGFGRVGTGTHPESRFVLETIKPGSIDGRQAPHISVVVFARGILSHLYTRIYFADESAANANDPVLTSVPEDRRATLLATLEDETSERSYRFDIRLQGAEETVFFDV